MRKQLKFRFIFLALLSVFFVSTGVQNLHAQTKKNKVRLKADYVKIMDDQLYLNISVSSKIDKKTTKISGIELTIYNETNDDKIELGKVKTDMNGESTFTIKSINSITPDSTNTYNLLVSFKGNETFKKSKKNISFKDVSINAQHIVKDSINYISATLIDKGTNNPIAEESLTIQVQRLFRPLRIGKEFNNTNENGTILVPIEEGIPGVDGLLNLEVVLNDHDDYGTVKAIIKAPIGIPIVEESTFDQRTLWSTRSKTPIFILIFANLLILGMWGIIIYLITNLFRINKTKI